MDKDSKRKKKKELFFTTHHEHTIEKIASVLLFNVLWLLFLWTFTIGKLVKSGFHDFFIHFTNWTWFANAFFFLLETLLLKIPRLCGYSNKNMATLYVLGFIFWVVNAMTWLVFWLVFIMFADNAGILLDMATEYDMGFLLDMDRLFHVVPLPVLLFYVLLEGRRIGWALSLLVYRTSFRSWISWFYLIVFVLASGLITLGVFHACFDMKVVYKITSPMWFILWVAFSVAIASNGLIFVYLRKRYVK